MQARGAPLVEEMCFSSFRRTRNETRYGLARRNETRNETKNRQARRNEIIDTNRKANISDRSDTKQVFETPQHTTKQKKSKRNIEIRSETPFESVLTKTTSKAYFQYLSFVKE